MQPRPGYYIVNFMGHQFEEPLQDQMGPDTARMRFIENMDMIDH